MPKNRPVSVQTDALSGDAYEEMKDGGFSKFIDIEQLAASREAESVAASRLELLLSCLLYTSDAADE